MFDLITYLVYLGLIVSIISLLYAGSIVKGANLLTLELLPWQRLNIFHWLALLLLCVVVGFRYNVGNDWGAYANYFEEIEVYSFGSVMDGNFELGFSALIYFLVNLGGHYTSMFFVVALISWYLIFKSVDIKLLPLLILFIFLDEYFFWSMNGMRQFVSISAFLYGIQFIIERKLLSYVLVVAFGTLFHTSAIILLPLYWLPWEKLYRPRIWFILYLVTIFLSNTSAINNLILYIIYSLGEVIPLLSSYLSYFGSDKLMSAQLDVGLGYLFKILVGVIIFLFCERVTDKYPTTKVYFVLFFVGAIIFNLFYMIHLIIRVNHYFMIMRSVVLSFIIYELWNQKYKRGLIIVFTLTYLLLFLVSIYNSSNMSSPYRIIIP